MDNYILFLCLVTCAGLVSFVWDRESKKDGEWHETNGSRMRRWHNGKWIYRSMTDEESTDYTDRMAM